ncbi:hypothetical protein Q7C15_20235 [Aeromonas salmonicida]|uniref:hypothetical protein n=1 Tax=Aeromonas salmonicida TaxID=645 RepID=UPI0035C12FBB
MSKDTPLLPLEYCRIDRAARLLGCEVEDILHWCALGAIEGAIWLSAAPALVFFVRDRKFVEDEGSHLALLYSLPSHDDDDQAPPQPIVIGCNATLTIPIARAKLAKQFGDLKPTTATASGLWSLDKTLFEGMLLERETYLSEWSLLPAGFYSGLERDYQCILLEPREDESPIDPSQIWIIKRDLVLLKKHIESGDPIPKEAYLQAQRASQKTPPQHPIAEYHAANRERVLAAAIYAERNQDWQDEPHCSADAWASKVINHEGSLFDAPAGQSGKCPLSQRKVAELLSEAIKSGRIRKKT